MYHEAQVNPWGREDPQAPWDPWLPCLQEAPDSPGDQQVQSLLLPCCPPAPADPPHLRLPGSHEAHGGQEIPGVPVRRDLQ